MNFLPVIQIQRRRQRKERRAIRLAVVILVGVVMLLLVNRFIRSKAKNSVALTTSSVTTQQNVISPASRANYKSNDLLENTVQASLEGTKGTYGIVIKNLKTGESYSVDEDKVFDAGSLYKLWVMATAFKNIQTGAFKEDQVLTEDATTLNSKFYIDPDAAEQTEGTITFTVHDALEQMITISHNYAALLLTEKLKLSSVRAFLEESGLKRSTVGMDGSNPTATPEDIALFFEKLYKGELANKENTEKMLDLLKRQRLKDKLSKYLSQDIVVAHKTGEIGWFSHDAGIVYSPNGDYIIAVLSESDFPLGAEDRIAEVSKAVYQYFEGKK